MPSWLIVVLVTPLFAWGVWRGIRDPSARGMSYFTALAGAATCIFVVIRALVT